MHELLRTAPHGWTVADEALDDLVLRLEGSEDLPWPPVFRVRRLADEFGRALVARLVAEQRLSLAECAVVHLELLPASGDTPECYLAVLAYRSGLVALASYQWFLPGTGGTGTVVAAGTCLAGDSGLTAAAFESLIPSLAQ